MKPPVKQGKLLRMARRIVALICFIAVMVLLVAGGSVAALYFEWIERVQILPVMLLSALLSTILWLLLTYLFGRIYCSTVCPLGTAMDIFSRLPRLTHRMERKRAYSYRQPLNHLRYSWLLLIIALLVVGLTTVALIFIPYDAFGNIVQKLFIPMFGKVVVGTVGGTIISAVTLLIIAFVAWRRGRHLCNTFCPVGTLLSIPARYSVYAIDINTDRCIGCNRCVEVCKSSCINPADHTVDSSRCVVCFNCLEVCQNNAINYTRHRHHLSHPLMILAYPPRTSTTLDSLSTSDKAE